LFQAIASLYGRGSKSLKNLNVSKLPNAMFESNQEVCRSDLPEKFAQFFDNKVKTITQSREIKGEVKNGTKKVKSRNTFLIDIDSVKSCIKFINQKITVRVATGYWKGF
jgi:hypothetical protein